MVIPYQILKILVKPIGYTYIPIEKHIPGLYNLNCVAIVWLGINPQISDFCTKQNKTQTKNTKVHASEITLATKCQQNMVKSYKKSKMQLKLIAHI